MYSVSEKVLSIDCFPVPPFFLQFQPFFIHFSFGIAFKAVLNPRSESEQEEMGGSGGYPPGEKGRFSEVLVI